MTATLPTWVRQRDGRLVPFDADRICQALFAATERLGRPDAFLARELTDGVVYFLAEEAPGTVAAGAWVSELVAKVVRELRHPDLARAFTDLDQQAPPTRHLAPAPPPPAVEFRFSPHDSPAAVARACLRAYSLHAVFSRDLVAAHQDGLLTLLGLEEPLGLAAHLVRPDLPDRPAAEVLVLDAPEYGSVPSPDFPGAAGPNGLVNLNLESPPSWAAASAPPPLFAEPPRPEPSVTLDSLLDSLLSAPTLARRARIDWHLSGRDFAPSADVSGQRRLLRLARAALDGVPLVFAFDRPRRPLTLGAGLDRAHSAALLAVGLHLPRLAELPGADTGPEAFLQKLPSLARLALSAGTQKRAFLRRRGRQEGAPGLGRAFFLERARLVAAPVGLEAAVRTFLGRGLCAGKRELEFAQRIVRCLRAVLTEDGERALLGTCLDTPWDFALAGGDPERPADVVGLTPWDPTAAPREQVRAAGLLHAIGLGGTAAVHLPPGGLSPEEVVSLLQFSWRQSEAARLRLVRADRQQQPTLPGL